MIFRDDESRIRKDHPPANFTALKHAADNLIRRALDEFFHPIPWPKATDVPAPCQ
jgi:hypothetical protein